MGEYRKGVMLAWAANILWGVYPVLFKQLDGIDPGVFVAYRLLYSAPFLLIIVFAFRQQHEIFRIIRNPSVMRLLMVSTALMGCNWGLYIWGVQNGRIIESSLGYFLTPVFSVIVGVLFFNERLAPRQWLAVAIAGTGVVCMAVTTGYIPWYGLLLGLAFTLYGAVRKLVQVEALNGVLVETLILLPIGLALLWLAPSDSFGHTQSEQMWLGIAGIVTALPLVWYIAAARRIPLATLGNLFYFCPAIGFGLGVFVYDEEFTGHHLVMFMLIWIGLSVYMLPAGFLRSRRNTIPRGEMSI
ncbi:MAG: membrane protein [marine bacterium B5-7]|nr:MAG: membrane protein [marine bacterium B5-7]